MAPNQQYLPDKRVGICCTLVQILINFKQNLNILFESIICNLICGKPANLSDFVFEKE